jgi:hypothetical protein
MSVTAVQRGDGHLDPLDEFGQTVPGLADEGGIVKDGIFTAAVSGSKEKTLRGAAIGIHRATTCLNEESLK